MVVGVYRLWIILAKYSKISRKKKGKLWATEWITEAERQEMNNWKGFRTVSLRHCINLSFVALYFCLSLSPVSMYLYTSCYNALSLSLFLLFSPLPSFFPWTHLSLSSQPLQSDECSVHKYLALLHEIHQWVLPVLGLDHQQLWAGTHAEISHWLCGDLHMHEAAVNLRVDLWTWLEEAGSVGPCVLMELLTNVGLLVVIVTNVWFEVELV